MSSELRRLLERATVQQHAKIVAFARAVVAEQPTDTDRHARERAWQETQIAGLPPIEQARSAREP
jgi:hypothetical protein